MVNFAKVGRILRNFRKTMSLNDSVKTALFVVRCHQPRNFAGFMTNNDE